MVTAAEIKTEMDKWTKKFDNPEFAAQFEGFTKVFQFSFPDINYNLQMVFANKKATLVEAFKADADMSLEVDSELFYQILKGEADPMEAFMEGTLKPKGTMSDLEKLQIFIED